MSRYHHSDTNVWASIVVILFMLLALFAPAIAHAEEPKGSGKNVNYVYESDGLGTVFGEKNAFHRGKPWRPDLGLAYSATHKMGYDYTLFHLRYTYEVDADGYSDIDTYFTEDGYWQVQVRRTVEF